MVAKQLIYWPVEFPAGINMLISFGPRIDADPRKRFVYANGNDTGIKTRRTHAFIGFDRERARMLASEQWLLDLEGKMQKVLPGTRLHHSFVQHDPMRISATADHMQAFTFGLEPGSNAYLRVTDDQGRHVAVSVIYPFPHFIDDIEMVEVLAQCVQQWKLERGEGV